MNNFLPSELILNEDSSVYHLKLLPTDIADFIIVVGDPNRVPLVSKYFDSIEIKKNNREFVTHTGTLGEKQISVLSTGMGVKPIGQINLPYPTQLRVRRNYLNNYMNHSFTLGLR